MRGPEKLGKKISFLLQFAERLQTVIPSTASFASVCRRNVVLLQIYTCQETKTAKFPGIEW